MKKALGILVTDGIFSDVERMEIETLIDYRNNIAHRLEELFGDISHPLVTELAQFKQSRNGSQYDYKAAEKLRNFQEQLYTRGKSKYVWVVSGDSLIFFGAEQALRSGLKRLDRTIQRQMAQRKIETEELKSEMSLKGLGFEGDRVPYHPHNQYESGKLTARGVEICYLLFDFGKRPIVASHLMRMSLRAVSKRFKMWEAIGGTNRAKVDFDALPIRK